MITLSNPHDASLPAWRDLLAVHTAGGVLDGLVVKIVPFGAFVEMTEGIVGLLHESEWADQPRVGSRISVRIKAIDLQMRRLSLEPA